MTSCADLNAARSPSRQVSGLRHRTTHLLYRRKRALSRYSCPFFDAIGSDIFQSLTSIITLEEVLVVPFRDGRLDLVEGYRNVLLNAAGLQIWNVGQQIAEEAAHIRATYRRIRTPDALQMATAVVAGADYFLTNDKALPDLPNLEMVVVDDLAQT